MANRYWVGGAGSWDATTTHWSTSSGGSGGASVPTAADDVFFDANSNTGSSFTCTLSGSRTCNNLNFTGFTRIFNPSSGTLAISGSLTFSTGMTVTTTNSATMNWVATSTGKTITTNGKTMFSTNNFTGVGGGWTFQDNAAVPSSGAGRSINLTNGTLDLNGKTFTNLAGFSISGSSTRTLTMGAAIVNTNGWTATTTTNLTFNVNTSSIRCAGTFAGGSLTYNELIMTQASNGPQITGSNTFATLKNATGLTVYGSVEITGVQTVTSVMQWVGNNANTQRLLVTAPITQSTSAIVCNGTITLTNVDFCGIVASGSGSWSGTSVGNCGGNTGITFTTAVNRYWVGNGGDFASTAKWSTSSGGSSGASVPLPQDTAFFDSSSFSSGSQTVTCSTSNWRYPTMTWTGATNSPRFNTSFAYFCGDITLISAMTIGITSNFRAMGRKTQTFSQNGATADGGGTLNVQSVNGKLQLGSDYNHPTGTSSQALSVDYGEFDANDYNVTVYGVKSDSGITRTVRMGNGTWTLFGLGTCWQTTASALTVAAEGSTIIIDDTSTGARQFDGSGKTYNNLTIMGTGNTTITVTGSNTFAAVSSDTNAHTIAVTASTTQTVTSFSVTGQRGALIKLISTVSGTFWTLSDSSGTNSVSYLSIKDVHATGGATYTAASSTDVSGNTGWTFTSAPANYSRFADASLATTGADRTTLYNPAEFTAVSTDDNVYVEQLGVGYVNHVFKEVHTTTSDRPTITWKGKTDLDPSTSTVYLQIWNNTGGTWETLDSNNSAAVSTEFTLTGAPVSTMTNYYDSSNIVTWRVYQYVAP